MSHALSHAFASANADAYPGLTEIPASEGPFPLLTPLSTVKPIVILASNAINDATLFINGLTQNIVVLYHLFEALGWSPCLLQHSITEGAERQAFLGRYRYTTHAEVVRSTERVALLIEIGMSLDAGTRGHLRRAGTRIVKLYLGNILNIDIETIQNYRDQFFNHHLVGELDEIWTSPHYAQHVEYAAVLNRVPVEMGKVVPYVWEPCFLERYGSREEYEYVAKDWRDRDIIIMDPNISFQKCSFYSLLLAEAFARAHPTWKGKVFAVNGDRLSLSPNALNGLLPNLTLWKEKRIVLSGRQRIHEVLAAHRSACFVTHQWNNDYNYMTLELFHYGYPMVHNSVGWAGFGYYYDVEKWSSAVETLRMAMQDHDAVAGIYRTHAANLVWRHSPHNPEVQKRWRDLLGGAAAPLPLASPTASNTV